MFVKNINKYVRLLGMGLLPYYKRVSGLVKHAYLENCRVLIVYKNNSQKVTISKPLICLSTSGKYCRRTHLSENGDLTNEKKNYTVTFYI